MGWCGSSGLGLRRVEHEISSHTSGTGRQAHGHVKTIVLFIIAVAVELAFSRGSGIRFFVRAKACEWGALFF